MGKVFPVSLLLAVVLPATGCGSTESSTTLVPETVEAQTVLEQPEDMESADIEFLPLNAGSAQWDNGVTLKTSVVGYEPIESALEEFRTEYSYFDTSKYPNGTYLLQLRYDITVPATYPEPFDRASLHCTGSSLSALSGAGDAVSATEFLGEGPTVSIQDAIFPGGSKYGITAYVVLPEAVNQELILESRCGGPETFYFRGRAPMSN